MKKLTVSVALCTYNGERYIEQQMYSIINQTKIPDQIIVCDDGSSDTTIEILRKISENCAEDFHCEIVIVQNEKNLGVTGNFEKCIGLCKGDIIFLSDQDDYWQSDKIDREIRAFDDSEVGLVFTNAHVVDENGTMYGHKLWDASRCSPKLVKEITSGNSFRIFLRKNFATGGTIAFRRECVTGLKIPKGWVHDHFIAFAAATQYKILPLNECLNYYRQHNDQQIGGAKDKFFKKVVLRLTTKKNVHRKYSAKVDELKELEQSGFFSETQIKEIKEFGRHMNNRDLYISLPFHKRLFKIVLGLSEYLKYVDGLYDAISDILRV